MRTLPLAQDDRYGFAMSLGSFQAMAVYGGGDPQGIAERITAAGLVAQDCDTVFGQEDL